MTSTPGEVFARRLREQRALSKITQAALAKRLSELLDSPVSTTAITKIEKGDRAVSLNEAVAVAQALGVPLAAVVSNRSPGEVRLEELRGELALHESRAHEAEAELKQAQFAMAKIEHAITELEHSSEN